MPNVTGRQLDVALEDIKSAGVNGDVEVVGGGAFGVIDESNWQVCEQSPAAGQAVTSTPELTVDRTCGEDTAEPVTTSTEPAPTTTEKPSGETAPATEVPKTDVPEETLTVDTNADFAALLVERDNCADSIGRFAASYGGRTIEFEGNIASMNNHGEYDTRYDILVAPGDFSETRSAGPAFQFRDVGILDLGLTGPNIPDSISAGDNLTIVARVGEFKSDSCLLFLDPVSTEVR